ncbi:hypothetical protein ACTWPT_55170 [Nonomuraea sp. 3N208]|uniref:hypothetical protein n=1 Tax=Nonomuraea sp. 3N208 TaxID=3457421 RepID=UPI003FD54207
MTPQQILFTLTIALRNADFVVHENDDRLTPSPFPGDAIAYIYRDQVELYLVEGTLRDGLQPDMAADRAAAAIDAAGLHAGPDAAGALLTGRIIVTAS